MKIAIFSDCYLDLPGGIPAVINAEKSELEKRGHTVLVFSSSYPKSVETRAKLAKQRIYPVPSCRVFGRGLTPIARRPGVIEKWLARHHPELADFDLFYIHYEAGCSIAGMRFARARGIPVVQVMHGREDAGEAVLIPRGLRTFVATMLNWFHSWYLPHPLKISRDDYLATTFASAKMWTLMVNHANFADLVLTPSRHFAEKLRHYGVKREIIVLPHGLPDELCEIPHPVREYHPSQGSQLKGAPSQVPTKSSPTPVNPSSGEVLQLIWHSRVSPEKRIMPFLESLTSVTIPYHLHIYGMGTELSRAKHYARRHHLAVTFHGQTNFDDLYRQITKSHLDILVSYNYDTFGMTLIEAESAGTPVFIVDPDMREIIPPGSALMARSPNPLDMAAALNSPAAHPERIAEMSEKMLRSRHAIKISHKIDKLEQIFAVAQTLRSDIPSNETL